MHDAELVIVHSFGSRSEADIAKSALEAAGIDSIIQADTGGGMRPHLAWAGDGFQILVREDDAAAARDVLDLPARQMP
jgi:Putative prokaryotic signal transducing protein